MGLHVQHFTDPNRNGHVVPLVLDESVPNAGCRSNGLEQHQCRSQLVAFEVI